MTAPSLCFLRHGSATPPPAVHRLRAGPFDLEYQAGDLRRIRLGDREVIRRIYAAVRDRHWGTVPGVLRDEHIEAGGDSFLIHYVSEHRLGSIHFEWRARIEGRVDGTLRFGFDGEAKASFLRNRIGLCVLHPILEGAGARVRARLIDGSQRDLAFPTLIAREQPIPGFHDLAGLDHEISPGAWAELDLVGDIFETEDQRNWIDASYKTYSTPLRLPRPVEIAAGTRLQQSVELRLRTEAKISMPSAEPVAQQPPAVRVEFDPSAHPMRRVPELGLGGASHGFPLEELEVERLSRICAAHLRHDLRLADSSWPARLRVAGRDSNELGVPLELGLHLRSAADGSSDTDLDAVLSELGRLKLDFSRILIFQDGHSSTPAAALAVARGKLGNLSTPLGTGTDADLYQLNLEPAPPGDFVVWSMNPQCHAFDLASLAETPAAAAQQVASVAAAYPGIPAVISPITLKARFNPTPGGAEPPTVPGELPAPVDARQLSLFGAAWTLALLASLSRTGVESLTWYETTGWRGLLETGRGSPLPHLFPSLPGGAFPVYHLLADLGPFVRGSVLPIHSSDPLRLAALALRAGETVGVWLANLTPDPLRLRFSGPAGAWRARRLDESNALEAMLDPEDWRADRGTELPREGTEPDLEFELPPCGLIRFQGTIA